MNLGCNMICIAVICIVLIELNCTNLPSVFTVFLLLHMQFLVMLPGNLNLSTRRQLGIQGRDEIRNVHKAICFFFRIKA